MRLDVPRVLSGSRCLRTLYPAVLVFVNCGLHFDIKVTESPSRYINVVCHEDPVGGYAGSRIIYASTNDAPPSSSDSAWIAMWIVM
jgi:hypothetical protein